MANYFKHPMALVESEEIGEGTRVWAFAHIMKGAEMEAIDRSMKANGLPTEV